MSGAEVDHGEASGPIAYMAGNSIAANLLMFAILALGLVSMTGLERESWPTVPFNTIEISMAYPGATPEEIEESIVVKIEEQVRGLEDAKTVKSVAAPGAASVRVELKTGTDMAEALDDVESAVGRIRTFPGNAERPQFREMTNAQSVIRLIVYGDMSERSLKELAHHIEDELAALPNVSLVDTSGTRHYEISIDVPLARLRALGLTLDDIAGRIRNSSLELSAGSINTRESQVRVRTLGQNYDQQDFEEIVLIARNDGTVLRIGDIAEVRDGFQDADLIVRHQNKPGVFVEVSRSDNEQVMDVAGAVHEHIAKVVKPSLPPGVGITIWNDESQTYSERVYLLLKNGSLGLMLVFIALALFLEIRLAVWVTAGLVTTIVGGLAVMLVFDLAINTISLFVFVLAIGIIVDDAIVVADSIHQERMKGTPGLVAAIRGARRISVPLTFAVLTSIAAFLPLLYIPGGVGQVWRALPIIVIGMLLISLIESIFILPNHLSNLHGPEWTPRNWLDRFFARTRGFVDEALYRFIDGPLDRGLRFATTHPMVVIASAVGMLILSVSLIPAGIIPTTFADVVEGDFVTAHLEMPDGTTGERTFEVAAYIEQTGREVIDHLSSEQSEGMPELLTGSMITIGQRARVEGGGLLAEPSLNPEANIATIEFKLVSAQLRDISTTQVAGAWRDEVGLLPFVRSVTFSGEVIDLGPPVEIALSHPDPDVLIQVGSSVVRSLRSVQGLIDVRADHAPGIKEVQLELRPEARTIGLSLEDLAKQTRAAFFGAEALRIQRDGEEVRVYVRLPPEERNSITDIERYLVRTPSGSEVPLNQVATLAMGTSAPAIRRTDGQRVVTVIADVDPTVTSAGDANSILADRILPELIEAYPDLTFRQGGEQQQQVESLGALYRGFVLAMLLIFALLAIPLRSYTKPFVIMSIIPFGLIGVIIGHLVLQIPISAATIMGVLGLSGVLVNDSLVMVDFIEQRRSEGSSPRMAIIEGAKGRFRPILLTSVTTFLGFTPLILERAIQAQFLMPFAAALGVGMLITTVLLMLVVPAISALHARAHISPA